MSPLQADEIFACLDRHGVRYVVIGGIAAVLHGSPMPTLDLDICPARDGADLARLAACLRDLEAHIRAPDVADGLPFRADPAFLASVSMLNLVTRFGDLDISFEPAGTAGYADLAARSVSMSISSLRVPVAALEDVIRSKEAAGRAKDLRTLPVLRQLLEEIRRRGG